MANYISNGVCEGPVNMPAEPKTLKQLAADLNSKMCATTDVACALYKTITGGEFELTVMPGIGDSAIGALEYLNARLEEVLCILDRTIGAIG